MLNKGLIEVFNYNQLERNEIVLYKTIRYITEKLNFKVFCLCLRYQGKEEKEGG
jgi:hypothetical protein